MNLEQQRIVSEKIKKDQAFVQFYMKEVSDLRNLRLLSINTAMEIVKSNRLETDKGSVPQPFDPSTVVQFATVIYDYLTSDGGMKDINDPIIKTFA